ncbi:HEAT repeat domain-containing protein [Persicimonas caeni]|uniref:HEAT repeat domain-containing protein n=1 Tax=Persicimonas caeni TaxID=2292766 RepID=A0A4Y6PU80_PERCE|nr:HEAT repeat domain-containing protein [Persicimonas caeni]QDG51881.1 HEAT repeat domain-containing protein [Persicimonas caeni]QED33102.1 HEAT repeat domain-containing protein [Persicimonas caeni]
MHSTGSYRPRGRLIVGVLVAFALAGPHFVQAQQAQSNPSAPASAEGDSTESERAESIRRQLVFALSAYHGAPTRDALDAIGAPDLVASHLRDLARTNKLRPSMRLRAVDMLGHYRDAKTVAFLGRVVDEPASVAVREPRQLELLHHHAIASFARIRGEQAVAKLAPLVVAGDLQLRLTAVTALGRFGGPAGRKRLYDLRTSIDDPVVLRTLNKYVVRPSKE